MVVFKAMHQGLIIFCHKNAFPSSAIRPLVERQTETTEDITFPQLRFREIIIISFKVYVLLQKCVSC